MLSSGAQKEKTTREEKEKTTRKEKKKTERKQKEKTTRLNCGGAKMQIGVGFNDDDVRVFDVRARRATARANERAMGIDGVIIARRRRRR